MRYYEERIRGERMDERRKDEEFPDCICIVL
jgi:hypothetical protein